MIQTKKNFNNILTLKSIKFEVVHTVWIMPGGIIFGSKLEATWEPAEAKYSLKSFGFNSIGAPFKPFLLESNGFNVFSHVPPGFVL
jgi:hypothetical protein